MVEAAYIPWRSEVEQSFATGQMNPRQMEKAMAAGTYGELGQVYEETGRQADRAARNRGMDIQEGSIKEQEKVGTMQSIASGAGALGSLYVGSKIADALKAPTASAAYTGGAGMGTATAESSAAIGTEVGTPAAVGADVGGTTGVISTIVDYLGAVGDAILGFFI